MKKEPWVQLPLRRKLWEFVQETKFGLILGGIPAISIVLGNLL